MEPSEAKELRQLRDENAKLKPIVADLSLDKAMLQDVLQKNTEAGQEARSREVPDVQMLVRVQQACRCVRLHRSAWYYRSHPDPQTELRQRVTHVGGT